MRKLVTSLLLFFSLMCFAQSARDTKNVNHEKTAYENNTYDRELPTNLREKYNDSEFLYREKKVKKTESSNINLGLVNGIIVFMKFIFPFLLGGFLIYIILKTVLNIDIRFWKKQKSVNNTTQSLELDNEDVHQLDLDSLLQAALTNNNFRLATRYYYLNTIKTLSDLKYIDFQIEKTNSDYLLEIDNESIIPDFSYLSYIYSYIWYGEFKVDAIRFKRIEDKYQSFFKKLKNE